MWETLIVSFVTVFILIYNAYHVQFPIEIEPLIIAMPYDRRGIFTSPAVVAAKIAQRKCFGT